MPKSKSSKTKSKKVSSKKICNKIAYDSNTFIFMKYPKFTILIATIIFAYFILRGRNSVLFHNILFAGGYFSAFICGILYAYSFSGAIATALLMVLAPEQNIILTGLIAGTGALFADWIIFKLIQDSFSDEIDKLSKEKWIISFNNSLPNWLRNLFIPIIASIIIASPLPDEIGVAMLAVYKLSPKLFTVISYVLNTGGIFIVLLIGNSI